MKRFFLLLIMLFLLTDCASAQDVNQLAVEPGKEQADLKKSATPTGNAAANQLKAKEQISESEKAAAGKRSEAVRTPEYYRQRLQRLEAILYEKTRKEVIKDNEVGKDLPARGFYDERKNEKQESALSIDEKTVAVEVERRLESEVLLKNFGKDFFEEGEISQGTLFSGAAPSNYLLGPGDELKIIVWSELGDETVYDVQVNPEGQVYVPILGVLGVAGITAGEFEQMVIGRLSGKFAHFKGQVTLTKVRTMQIFVVGEVERPGAMTISGLGTAFTALYQAGGPTTRGSMRNIKVLDTKGTAKEIDLYRYLLSGDRSHDMPLKNGDTVFVPVVGFQARIMGMVTRPAVYEILPQTTLADALQMAGNAQAMAYSGRVQVTRWTGDNRRQSYDISLNDAAALKSFIVANGDEISVERAIETVGNKVVVEGAVARPGEYSFDKGFKVADLIKRAGGLVAEEANLEHGQIIRKGTAGKEEVIAFNVKFAMAGDKDHNRDLLALDRVRLYAQKDLAADTRIISLDGAVRRPGQYVYRDGMRLADLVVNARGLAVDAAGEVEIARVKDGDRNEIIKANINVALETASSTDNIVLRPLDKVSVLARGDKLMEPEIVVLKGQVKFPGPYALEYRGERLSSVIKRAGGLTTQAFPDGAIFLRKVDNISSEQQLETAENVQTEMFRQATLDLRADLLRAGASLDSLGKVDSNVSSDDLNKQILDAKGTEAVSDDGADSQFKDLNKETSKYGAIEMQSRKLRTEVARIPIPFRKIVEGKAQEYEDLPLVGGDQITVPMIPKTVSILGAVINPTTILFCDNRDARYYINRAGGFSAHSDHRRTVIIKANGEVMPMRSVRKIGRGDIVLVPPKPKLVKPDKIKEFSNLASILGNLAVTYKVVNDAK